MKFKLTGFFFLEFHSDLRHQYHVSHDEHEFKYLFRDMIIFLATFAFDNDSISIFTSLQQLT